MEKLLLTFMTIVTSVAAGISFYFATLENPTDTQKQLSDTTNKITFTGTSVIFRYIDKRQGKSKPN